MNYLNEGDFKTRLDNIVLDANIDPNFIAKAMEWCDSVVVNYIKRTDPRTADAALPLFVRRVVRPADYELIRALKETNLQAMTDYIAASYATLPTWAQRVMDLGELLYVLEFETEFCDTLRNTIEGLVGQFPDGDWMRISVPQAVRHSEQWIEQVNRRALRTEGKTARLMEFPDGRYLVKLQDQQALTREGALMHNCVATYGNRVLSGATNIYSLRAADNTPLLTAEVDSDQRIVQVLGPNNKPAAEDLIQQWTTFASSQGFKARRSLTEGLGARLRGPYGLTGAVWGSDLYNEAQRESRLHRHALGGARSPLVVHHIGDGSRTEQWIQLPQGPMMLSVQNITAVDAEISPSVLDAVRVRLSVTMTREEFAAFGLRLQGREDR